MLDDFRKKLRREQGETGKVYPNQIISREQALTIPRIGQSSSAFDRVKSWPGLKYILSSGNKKILGICQLPGGLHCRIDFELVEPYEYQYTVVYFTEPGSASIEKNARTLLQDGI